MLVPTSEMRERQNGMPPPLLLLACWGIVDCYTALWMEMLLGILMMLLVLCISCAVLLLLPPLLLPT